MKVDADADADGGGRGQRDVGGSRLPLLLAVDDNVALRAPHAVVEAPLPRGAAALAEQLADGVVALEREHLVGVRVRA